MVSLGEHKDWKQGEAANLFLSNVEKYCINAS